MRRETTEPDWSEEYFQQQQALRRSQGFKTLLDPSVFGACLAIGGRIVIGPLVLLLLFVGTGYLTDGTVFIGAEDSFFRFTALDLGMSGGCAGCVGACKVSFYKFTLFHGEAIASTPALVSVQALPPTESLYDFSVLTSDQLALAAELDNSGVICQGGRNEWGNAANVITGTSTQLLRIIEALDLSITPQNIRELELDANRTDGCITAWSLGTLTRLFRFPTSAGTEFGRISAIDISIFPDYAECRPEVEVNDELVGSKLSLATNGEDLLAVYPEVLRLCPYSFGSSLPHVPRVRSTADTETHYPTATVLQPLLNAYYGGCRVREVNTTGVFIEDTCEISKHWATYGLMVQSPDNIPLCTIGDVCVYNFYNTRWEWINSLDTTQPNRVVWTLNTFRNRYAATVAVSVLPGVVVMQMLLMGMISLYQVMSHKRSVLLTQVWAYRCQNGRMQVVYLAQVTYHLIYNSDMYLIGFATGTLTTESIANLTCCFFAFSYSFINLIKARSGDQKLDRHFRLTWETMQTVITFSVGAILYSIRREPQDYIFTENAEILRKNSVRGRIYCGLNDSCTLFKVNLVVIVAIIALGLGVVALVASFMGRRMNARPKRAVIRSVRLSVSKARNLTKNPTESATAIKVSVDNCGDKKYQEPEDDLTSFERNCIGAPFRKLFHDCDDMAYVTYNGKKCITVEALLLTGYLYYGEHIYQASSVMLLLVARLIPSKILRTFNVLLLRWYVDPKEGTLSHALSCTWFTASADNHKFAGSTPAA